VPGRCTCSCGSEHCPLVPSENRFIPSALHPSRHQNFDRVDDEHGRSSAWGPGAAGAIGGFGATIWLATLGAALGLSASAAIANDGVATSGDAVGLGAGAIGWLLVSALIVGIVGGGLLAWTGRGRGFRAVPWAVVTWAGGVTLAAIVGSLGTTGMMSSIGAATGTRAAESVSAADRGFAGETTSRSADRSVSGAEAAQAAETAAKAGAALAWAAALAQLVGLVATVVSARAFHRRFLVVGEEDRTASLSRVPNPA
jgi:hypothetical protein